MVSDDDDDDDDDDALIKFQILTQFLSMNESTMQDIKTALKFNCLTWQERA
jgi:hypothetical protein